MNEGTRARRTPYVGPKGQREKGIYTREGADGKVAFEIGWRDAQGKQRWRRVAGGLKDARAALAEEHARRGRGEKVTADPKMRFGDAADRWLAEEVTDLRASTQATYRNHVEQHLRPRWGKRRMDSFDFGDAKRLVTDLRSDGLSEWTIAGITRVGSRIFTSAARHGWQGHNPFGLLNKSERPKPKQTAEQRVYQGDELAQVIAATNEPWTTLFKLAEVIGARESELLGLWWEDLKLSDLDNATIRFSYQLDRSGERVPLKTNESKATLPLPRSTALMLLEHKARSSHTGPRAFVFATRTGMPLSQRNVLRALYKAQERARDAEGKPTFPQLFQHDERGHLVVDDKGRYALAKIKRSDIALPDFHAIRHAVAMSADDAEEARDLLRHKNSNVTREIYRAHFDDKRRESLRAKLEARHGGVSVEADVEASDRSNEQQSAAASGGTVRQLRA